MALTRAQEICFIMGPLDMRGLVGASTIIGCLKYGACFSGLDDQEDPVFLVRLKDDDLVEAPDDAAFLQSLRFSCSRVIGVYPPLALAEAFITEEDNAPRVRRLHLMIVDLHRRRRMADRVLRLLVDIQIDRCAEECWNTLPIPWKQNQEAYQLRYVFGYAMDGSDLPCYILWPSRTDEQSFWCIDAWKGDWVRLDKCSYMAPLGIEHFFDAFCFEPQRPWRAAACQALDIPSCHGDDSYLEQGQEQVLAYLLQGASRSKGRHQLLSEKTIKTLLRKRKVYRMLRVGGQVCQTIPPRTLNVLMWRPPRWRLTRTDLTRPMMPFETWLMTCMALTSNDTLEGSPVRMQRVYR